MEKGKAGLLLRAKDGGSIRLKGELDGRRLESRPIRLCFGEPRLVVMLGVEAAVFGVDVSALRTEGKHGDDEMTRLGFAGDCGVARRRKLKCGLEGASVVLERLVGELKTAGSRFSESSSSSKADAERFPIDCVLFNGEEKEAVMAAKSKIISCWF